MKVTSKHVTCRYLRSMHNRHYECCSLRRRSVLPPPCVSLSHSLQGNSYTRPFSSLTVTFCKNQLGVDPELSWRILTCLSLPRSGKTRVFVSFFPLEKCVVSSFLNPESPFSPYKVMYTLASVSAPSTSPVSVVTV